MNKTRIEWADRSWNPVTGCTPVSSGCTYCYAKAIAERFWVDGRKFSDVRCHDDRLSEPARLKKPQRIFVNSMSDLFHPDVPDEFIYRVFKAMSQSPHHSFMVLTKRPERMPDLVSKIRSMLPDRLNHVWLGVTTENQQTAIERIPLLLNTPASVRFVSVEPMLESINMELQGLDWIVCGSETGIHKRPMNLDWARSLRDQCITAGIPVLFQEG